MILQNSCHSQDCNKNPFHMSVSLRLSNVVRHQSQLDFPLFLVPTQIPVWSRPGRSGGGRLSCGYSVRTIQRTSGDPVDIYRKIRWTIQHISGRHPNLTGRLGIWKDGTRQVFGIRTGTGRDRAGIWDESGIGMGRNGYIYRNHQFDIMQTRQRRLLDGVL